MVYKAAKVNQRGDHGSGVRDERSPMVLKDEELVNRAQQDDRWATDELVRRYHEKAFKMAYHMSAGDIEEAQDLTQEAFLRVFRHIKNFRGQSSFYTWFYRIVVNTCLDGRRRHQKWKRIFSFRGGWGNETAHEENGLEVQSDRTKDHDPMTVLSGKELAREMRTALVSLSEKQRMAFLLKVNHGMSIREIAQIMGMAEGTVKSHLFRATQFMREALQDWA